MGAQAGFESEESGGASSSDEGAVDYYSLKMAVFQENMAAVDREIHELETVGVFAFVNVCLFIDHALCLIVNASIIHHTLASTGHT